MLTIICGEDTISSRNYLLSLKKQYGAKNFEIKNISVLEIESLTRWLAESATLFSEKRVFFSEHLNKLIRAENKKLLDELKQIERLKDVELIDWESVSLFELKLAKVGRIREFKPKDSVFKLLDNLYPTNKTNFILLLETLSKESEEQFLFTMIHRHVRKLLLVKSAAVPARVQPWQLQRLKFQAGFWKSENLINFYEALFRIELGIKTSSTPYSIKDSLAILACHFL